MEGNDGEERVRACAVWEEDTRETAREGPRRQKCPLWSGRNWSKMKDSGDEVMGKAAEGDGNTNVCSFIRLCFNARYHMLAYQFVSAPQHATRNCELVYNNYS